MSFPSTSPISRFWHTVTTPPAAKQQQQKHQPRSHSSTTKLLNKMFVRSGNNLPADPGYPDSLEELGYMINAKGQVVSIAPPHSFSPSYISDSERANEVHREALHGGVRRAVKKDLAKLGVRPIYCGGPDGTRLSDEPVKGSPSLPIFTTDLSELQNKRDIIVVIGEHNQDPIVWAWRSAMRESGLQEATAVGLVRKLMTLGFGGLPSRDKADAAGVAKAGVTITNRIDSVGAADDSNATPGLILLNPGQRLYSPQLNEAMTQVSWLARPKPNALAQPHKIDNDHNKIPGHHTPYEHVETFFDGVLDQLIVHESSLRLWIVGISDGAEAFINYMDAQLHRDHTAKIGSIVSGMAFMEPAHDPTMLKSQTTKTFLHSTGKCWIKSSKPMGTWVNAPGAMKKIVHPSQEHHDEDADSSRGDKKVDTKEVNEAASRSTESLVIVPNSIDSQLESHGCGHEGSESLAGCEPVIIPDLVPPFSPTIKNKHLSMSTVSSAESEVPAPSDPRTSLESATHHDPDVNDDDEDPLAESYDYDSNVVSCPTYSAGVDTDELIWPAVMDEVLDFFKSRAEEENLRDAMGKGLVLEG